MTWRTHQPETKVAWARAKKPPPRLGSQKRVLSGARSEGFRVWAICGGRCGIPNQRDFSALRRRRRQAGRSLEWVLLDFGRRAGAVSAARERLLAANLGFNARHLEIVFQCSIRLYKLSTVRGRISVAQAAWTRGEVQESSRGKAQARAGHGARSGWPANKLPRPPLTSEEVTRRNETLR